MFHKISPEMAARMAELEAVDARDRSDGTPQSQRLRQVPPESGKFIALLSRSAPPGQVVELGASGGYSGMWLALACRERGDRLTTVDFDAAKVARAQETFAAADVSQQVEVVQGDARDLLRSLSDIAFCFIDLDKQFYQECYDLAVPRLIPGGLLVADNMISHAEAMASFIAQAEADDRLDALVVPIGKGMLVGRKV